MDIKNFNIDKIQLLATRHERAQASLREVQDQLLQNLPESDGGTHYRQGKAVKRESGGHYGLFIHIHTDGSGPFIDLTGLLMHNDLLRHIEGQLKIRIEDLEKEIAAL